MTVGDFIVQRLRDWGVKQVFAYPGDGINGIVAAFGKADNDRGSCRRGTRRWPRSRAVGYAKFTGRWACAWQPPAPVRSIC